MYSGYTGEQLEGDIFIGPTYYMRLKHMVKDKINHRARGPRNVLTRQTVQGRANDGGLRIGEMERDGILGHGAAHMLTESFMERGDEYFLAICNKTGGIAVYNKALNIFFSPFADGPIHFSKDKAGLPILDVFSRYGRSFSIVRIPYALKLLIQELQVMNVQMRIITDKNIDQLMNMGFDSNNLTTLVKYRTDNSLLGRKMEEYILQQEKNCPFEAALKKDFVTIYRNVLRNKMIGDRKSVEEIPELEKDDFSRFNKKDEVSYILDNDRERKWEIKKILNNDAIISTLQLENLPGQITYNKDKTEATKLVKLDNLMLYSDLIQQIESTPNSEDNESIQFEFKDSPDENLRLRNPDSISSNTMNSPPYAPYSTSSLGEKSNNNNQVNDSDLNAPAILNLPGYAQLFGKKTNNQVYDSVSSTSSKYDPNAPSDPAEKKKFYDDQRIEFKELKKQQRGETKFMEREDTRGPTLNLDFDKINFINLDSTPKTSSKLDILEVEEEKTPEKTEEEKSDSGVKKIVNIDN